jgi:hypothetical protein
MRVEKDERGIDGLNMLREEDIDSDKDIGVFLYGKSFKYSKKDIVTKREEKHKVFEKRDPCVTLISHHTRKGKRKKRILSVV